MLGSSFMRTLAGREDFEMYAFARDDLDITDFKALHDIFKQISPDFVLNCAAYTDVDGCEADPELAFKVNSEAPGVIADVCNKENAVLLHFSTDYVFDGKKKDGYKESDTVGPVNVYGESKLKGEEVIKGFMKKYYIVRTSWLFGPKGKNFVDTMISLSGKTTPLSVVSDQFGSPSYTFDLCEAVIDNFLAPYLANVDRLHEYQYSDSIPRDKKALDFGTYHLSNSGTCSWYDFAKEIFRLIGSDIELKAVKSSEFPRPAVRPNYSILLNTKLDAMRPWTDSLKSYIELYHKR